MNFIEGSKSAAQTALRKAARDTTETLYSVSPVKTGRYLASHNARIGDKEVDTPTGRLTGAGSGLGQARANKQLILSLIRKWKLKDSIIAFGNSAPYATRVEHGWTDSGGYGFLPGPFEHTGYAVFQRAMHVFTRNGARYLEEEALKEAARTKLRPHSLTVKKPRD